MLSQGSAQNDRNAELVEAARATTSIPNARQKETLKRIANTVQPVDPAYLKDYGPVPAGYPRFGRGRDGGGEVMSAFDLL
jgi:hypothetical protein